MNKGHMLCGEPTAPGRSRILTFPPVMLFPIQNLIHIQDVGFHQLWENVILSTLA